MALENMTALIKNEVRILRPCEVKALISAIPKNRYRILFKGLLYSGLRYIEAKRLQENKGWFDGTHIYLPSWAEQKKKRKQVGRTVWLSSAGKEVISAFIENKSKLPGYASWDENLNRWAKVAGLSKDKNTNKYLLSSKTTRKTIESWLVVFYPDKLPLIALSQGHNTDTAIRHYWNIAFTESDKLEMKDFVVGWS